MVQTRARVPGSRCPSSYPCYHASHREAPLSVIPSRQPLTTVTVKRNLHAAAWAFDSTTPLADVSGNSYAWPRTVDDQDSFCRSDQKGEERQIVEKLAQNRVSPNQPINQSIAIKLQSIPINRNQSISRSINRSINPSIAINRNQSINQSISMNPSNARTRLEPYLEP